MKRTYRYYVGGNFGFPNDMLRYDRAKIVEVIQKREWTDKHWQPGIWLIEGECMPTVARWRSFLFSVWYDKDKCPFYYNEERKVYE